MIVMRTASGKLCHINNSRRASYGYDQRIEVHGSEGRLMAGNHTGTTVEVANAKRRQRRQAACSSSSSATPPPTRRSWRRFLACLKSGKKMPVGAVDGREALVLAEAALQSHRTGKRIKIRGR